MEVDVYAALLAALEPGVLYVHCDHFLRKHLVQTQQSVDDAAVAFQRLRDVTRAAQKLQLQNGNEQLHMPFKDVAKLQRRVARALKRVTVSQANEFDYDAEMARVATGEGPQVQLQTQETAAVAETELAPHVPSSKIPPAQRQLAEESCALTKSSVPDFALPNPDRDTDVGICAVEKQREHQLRFSDTGGGGVGVLTLHLLNGTQSTEKGGVAMEKPLGNRKRPRDDSLERDESHEVGPPVADPDAKPDAVELYEALLRLKDQNPQGDFVALVEREMHLPVDFQSSSRANQVAAIRTLAAGIKALSAAPMYKHGSQLTHKQRLMVAAVVAEAVTFFAKFVVPSELSSEPSLDPSELLAMLDCIESTKIVFRDLKVTMARLRKSEHDLTEFVRQTHESEFQEWELDRKLTGSKRREFENMRTTLLYWTESQKCRGSALDRLMDQFESLLAKSLSLWDVAKDDTVQACVDSMTTMASLVGGSIEKCAARLTKLDVFQNILSNDVPVVQTARAIRARNMQIARR